MPKQTGPSMSTESGWMAAVRACPLLLGDHGRRRPQFNPSMLLSFERPASVGNRVDTPDGVTDIHGYRPAFTPLYGP
jgi:hypothetical protein